MYPEGDLARHGHAPERRCLRRLHHCATLSNTRQLVRHGLDRILGVVHVLLTASDHELGLLSAHRRLDVCVRARPQLLDLAACAKICMYLQVKLVYKIADPSSVSEFSTSEQRR